MTDDPAPAASRGRSRNIIEWIVIVGAAVLLAVLVRTFVVQLFSIPSESMENTLLVGDRVAVEKVTFHRRDPVRGDVIVFDNPDKDKPVPAGTKAPPGELIKRVIGVGGDTIVFADGKVQVNGVTLDEPYLKPGSTTSALTATYACSAAKPCVVPDAAVWVMGDNRLNSGDSRVFGPIRTTAIVGRAWGVVWPFSRFGGL